MERARIVTPQTNGFDSHISLQLRNNMNALALLKVMAHESSGISEYWRLRIQNLINSVPTEPRNMVEVVDTIDEVLPIASVAETD